jgi:helicase
LRIGERRAVDGDEPDDLVVIAFSGHGTETHELVAFDTDPDELGTTAISLERLGEWVRAHFRGSPSDRA